jgi:hypothetical protein
MSIEDCKTETTDTKIKVQEGARKAVFLNEARESFAKIKVDGCMVEQELASDWVVSRATIGDVVVELKGKDVSHAIVQIRATIDQWNRDGLRVGKIAGLIVCSQYPKFTTIVQRAKIQLKKDYGAPLHVSSRNMEYDFEQVLEY